MDIELPEVLSQSTIKYGLDLDNPKSNENWNDEYEGVFNELLIPKMEKVLRKNNF